MPSSTLERPRSGGPQKWFTAAAIESIATCVSCDLLPEERNAGCIIQRYLESDRSTQSESFGLRNVNFIEGELSGRKESFRLYIFAGLLELAVSVGYIDLEGWKELTSLWEALKDFEKRENLIILYTVDLTLIQALLARLEARNYRSATTDNNSFYAFASYLQLTRAVHTDSRCHSFIAATADWEAYKPNSDFSFLLSPRHFSEALADGTVAGIPAPALIDGLVTLDYFRWFTEILSRISRDSELTDRLIRHSRWSHQILKVHQRLDVWAARMGEWDELAADSEREVTEANEKRLELRPSKSELSRLDLSGHFEMFTLLGLPKIELPAFEWDEEESKLLLAEGRKGAVKQRLLCLISLLDPILSRPYSYEKTDRPVIGLLATTMVTLCQKLDKLGVTDTAAAILAKYTDYFTSTLGPDHEATTGTFAIVARSRVETQNHPPESKVHAGRGYPDSDILRALRADPELSRREASQQQNYLREGE